MMTGRNVTEYKAATLECKLFYTLQSHNGSFLFLKGYCSFPSISLPSNTCYQLNKQGHCQPYTRQTPFQFLQQFLVVRVYSQFHYLAYICVLHCFNSSIKQNHKSQRKHLHLHGLRHKYHFHIFCPLNSNCSILRAIIKCQMDMRNLLGKLNICSLDDRNFFNGLLLSLPKKGTVLLEVVKMPSTTTCSLLALPRKYYSTEQNIVLILDKHISLTCVLSFPASSLGFINRKRKL